MEEQRAPEEVRAWPYPPRRSGKYMFSEIEVQYASVRTRKPGLEAFPGQPFANEPRHGSKRCEMIATTRDTGGGGVVGFHPAAFR